MLRSMYSGISGMKGFQTKLDVIGNNIANVNTYGFKKGRVIFKDMISQNLSGASAPGAARGGTNPMQVGLGVQLGAIDTVHTEGSTQTTNFALDLSITGDGFFVVEDNGVPYYTRAGNFNLDKEGNLVNSDGLFVQGTDGNNITLKEPAVTNGKKAESISIGQDGVVTIKYDDNTTDTSQTVAVVKFVNPNGLQKIGGNLFTPTANSGDAPATLTAPGTGGAGTLAPGTLEMSNVDLSEEFTEMIVAQRGFQANTRIITTSDEILQELVNLKR
ncbi:flagellar basal-body rod protein FlgF [Bacillaceae bacterium SAS-127]|nr:flagellar basal-body rod protein FlgF [Bacillaceae bacterium SAS-127]